MGRDNIANIINQFDGLSKSAEALSRTEEFGGTFNLPIIELKITKTTSTSDFAKTMSRINALAIQYIRDEMKEALDAAMTNNIWEGGDDIIDTGELMNSLEISIQDNKVRMEYLADYASFVHYGGYISPYGNTSIEKVYIPGRPWIEAVIEGYAGIEPFNFVEIYNRAFKQVVG